MKNILSVMLVSTALTGAALSNPAPMAPSCPPCVKAEGNWGGFFLGPQLGYAHGVTHSHQRTTFVGLFDTDTDATITSHNTLGSKGWLGGFHVGYHYQFNKNMTVGVNTSIDWTNVRGKNSVNASITTEELADELGDVFTQNVNVTNSIRQKWTVAVVPQLALVGIDGKIYIGAGWAGSKFSTGKMISGLRLQTGAAYKMGKVILGVEANYDIYGSATKNHHHHHHNNLNTEGAGVFNTQHHRAQPRVLSGLFKISYQLGN
jgi:hypothetical protein